MSLLEDTDLKKFSELISPTPKPQLQEAAHKLLYHLCLYASNVNFDKKKYAFKYWKVIVRQQKKAYEYESKTKHNKHITFMNSEDFSSTKEGRWNVANN